MTYLRSLFLNFLIVFFVDRMIPGVEITNYEDVPNIAADIFFSLVVGFLNASVYPGLTLFDLKPTAIKLALVTFVISFGAFALIAVMDFGVQVISYTGFFLGGIIVWAVAFFSNYLEEKNAFKK